jgi:hypothetical protein
MENNQQPNKGRDLLREEEQELREGQALRDMELSNEGWHIIKKWLETMAFHSWVDPRDVENKEQWEWRELNGFHAANVAKELMENVAKAISRSEYLQKVKNGEIDQRKFRI